MEKIIYAMKDLMKNYFNWHGRLSRAGYLWSWAVFLAVNVILVSIRVAVHLHVFLSNPYVHSHNEPASEVMLYVIRIWNIVMFCPILSATIRRYHDSGNAAWKAIILNVLCPVFIVSGFFIGAFVVIAFVFGGGYMVTADTNVKMAGLLGYAAFSAFLLLAGTVFGILNLIYIFRRSDPEENKYGKPIPFNPVMPMR